jgi:hypothetical protein
VSRFVCRFAVGRDGHAYSGVWRVWTAKNKPDLYIAVRALGGELKATVHAPHPPHTGWERHFGFDKNAASSVSQQAKKDGGPHKVRWTGCNIGPDTTVEYRIIVRGTSLEQIGQPVANEVVLLPVPSYEAEFRSIIRRRIWWPRPDHFRNGVRLFQHRLQAHVSCQPRTRLP